jgi:hypothetical protein
MKFSDFNNSAEMLSHFGITVQTRAFTEFEQLEAINIPQSLKEDFDFVLSERADTDKEFYACEFLIASLLKEAWKRNPKAKLFSHPRIVYEDLVLIPDYVVGPKNKSGLNFFEKPLLVTVEARNDDYDLGWTDAYKQFILCRLLNQNDEIPIYALVSIGDGWQIGKLNGNIIQKHPYSLGLANAGQLLGVLDYIFADCVRTAERFGMY